MPPAPPAAPWPFHNPLSLHIGCDLTFELEWGGPMMFIVAAESGQHPSTYQEVRAERLVLPENSDFHQYYDSFGNRVWRILAAPGTLRLRYDVWAVNERVLDPQLPHLQRERIEHLPDNVVQFLMPSRYVQSDMLQAEAWELFGDIGGGWAQVQAICDHLKTSIPYKALTDSTHGALEAYRMKAAVCRDFAHLGVAFCRALSIPARYTCGYLPDVDVPPDGVPMDFHAWFEAFLEGQWRSFDARHNVPRTGRIVVAHGRDAADVAFATYYGGTRMSRMTVMAEEVAANFALPSQASLGLEREVAVYFTANGQRNG
jgi:transglutaminase-like putative cysteine protease